MRFLAPGSDSGWMSRLRLRSDDTVDDVSYRRVMELQAAHTTFPPPSSGERMIWPPTVPSSAAGRRHLLDGVDAGDGCLDLGGRRPHQRSLAGHDPWQRATTLAGRCTRHLDVGLRSIDRSVRGDDPTGRRSRPPTVVDDRVRCDRGDLVRSHGDQHLRADGRNRQRPDHDPDGRPDRPGRRHGGHDPRGDPGACCIGVRESGVARSRESSCPEAQQTASATCPEMTTFGLLRAHRHVAVTKSIRFIGHGACSRVAIATRHPDHGQRGNSDYRRELPGTQRPWQSRPTHHPLPLPLARRERTGGQTATGCCTSIWPTTAPAPQPDWPGPSASPPPTPPASSPTPRQRSVERSRTTCDTLDEIADRLGCRPSRGKILVARAAEFVGRLKPNGRLRGYSPLSRLVELELLVAGILTKESLWQTLTVVQQHRSDLAGFDFDDLQRRAMEQRMQLEAHRIATVKEALLPVSAPASGPSASRRRSSCRPDP